MICSTSQGWHALLRKEATHFQLAHQGAIRCHHLEAYWHQQRLFPMGPCPVVSNCRESGFNRYTSDKMTALSNAALHPCPRAGVTPCAASPSMTVLGPWSFEQRMLAPFGEALASCKASRFGCLVYLLGACKSFGKIKIIHGLADFWQNFKPYFDEETRNIVI